MVTVEDTHTVTSTFINTLRFGFNRVAAFSGQNISALNSLATNASTTFSAVPNRPAPGINIGGGIASFQGGLGASPNYRFHWNSFQFYDDAFFTKGIHFLKFGFATEYIQDNILASSDANGVVVFPSLTTFLSNATGIFDVLPLPYLYELLVPLSAPFFDLRTISGPPQGSFPDLLFGQIAVPTTRRQSFIEHNPKRPYVLQWNLNVQREVVKNITGTIAYVGSRSAHQVFRADDINTTQPQTPLSAFGPVYFGVDAAGNALGTPLNVNAGQISSVIWSGDAHN